MRRRSLLPGPLGAEELLAEPGRGRRSRSPSRCCSSSSSSRSTATTGSRSRAARCRFAQFYVPAIVSFGLISACYTNLGVRRDPPTRGRDPQADAGHAAATGASTWPASALNSVIVSIILVDARHRARRRRLRHHLPGAVPRPGGHRLARRLLLRQPRRRGVDVHPERGRGARHHQLRRLPAAVHLGHLRAGATTDRPWPGSPTSSRSVTSTSRCSAVFNPFARAPASSRPTARCSSCGR